MPWFSWAAGHLSTQAKVNKYARGGTPDPGLEESKLVCINILREKIGNFPEKKMISHTLILISGRQSQRMTSLRLAWAMCRTNTASNNNRKDITGRCNSP